MTNVNFPNIHKSKKLRRTLTLCNIYGGQWPKCMDSNIFIKILTLLPDNVFRVCVSFFLFFLGVGCDSTHFQIDIASYSTVAIRNEFYKVGTKVSLHCGNDSYLVGPENSTCQASGSWVPEPGRCFLNSKFHYWSHFLKS